MRIRLISFSFLIVFMVIIVRLFYWQIVKGEVLSKQARDQYVKKVSFDAPRGNILAGDGSWLAARRETYLAYASLKEIEGDKEEIADKLAEYFIDKDLSNSDRKTALLDEAGRLKTLLNRDDLVWIALKHNVAPDTKESIEELSLNGLGFEYEESRSYPEASTAAHLLGFVGKNEEGESQGYFGLEGYYDQILSGKPGFRLRDSDGMGVPILFGNSRELGTQTGVDLLTNIDKSVQLSIENKLSQGIEKYGAKGGSVIVMDPKNGEVLGMSSQPSFDPINYSDYSNDLFINPAVSLSFEPGSVFKVIVMASALDSKVIEHDTKCDICAKPVKVDKYTIETWNQEYRPDSTMTDVIVHSDNVGMVFVGRKIGIERFSDYLSKFGMGEETGIDLQGEMTPGIRKKDDWSEVDLATASFGQGVAVTPIQIIRAVSAIANGGYLVKPQVVKGIMTDDWEEFYDNNEKQRIISEKAAAEVTSMMVEAAKNGEAKWTHLKGFKVAGKTGTAQIPIAGHYDDEKTIASFIGFAPPDDPKFIMLVTLKEPQSSPWASETAAPLWYSIAKDLFLYFGIQPEK